MFEKTINTNPLLDIHQINYEQAAKHTAYVIQHLNLYILRVIFSLNGQFQCNNFIHACQYSTLIAFAELHAKCLYILVGL